MKVHEAGGMKSIERLGKIKSPVFRKELPDYSFLKLITGNYNLHFVVVKYLIIYSVSA